MIKRLGVVAATAALIVGGPVSAAETIALFSGQTQSTSTANGAGRVFSNGDIKVNVTAWTNYNASSFTTANGRIAATLGVWDQGVGSQLARYDGEHTVDNKGNSLADFILLQFDRAVALNTVTFTSGWFNMYDSDATISRANVNYNSQMTFKTTGSAFWNAAGAQLQANKVNSNTPNNNFKAGVVNTSRRQVNPTLVTSNVWLIAARIGNNDTYSDSFKIKGLTYIDPHATSGAVPEPATWAMLILGFGTIGGAMRRRQRGSLALA